VAPTPTPLPPSHHHHHPEPLNPALELNQPRPIEKKKRMDRYEVLKPIGEGKFALVFKARRREDGALVALKRVAIDAMDERGRAKCLKEVGGWEGGYWCWVDRL
jgi:serine/threonine protein kinase